VEKKALQDLCFAIRAGLADQCIVFIEQYRRGERHGVDTAGAVHFLLNAECQVSHLAEKGIKLDEAKVVLKDIVDAMRKEPYTQGIMYNELGARANALL
jgi:hypothetical protein